MLTIFTFTMLPKLNKVKHFWETNPLFSGESSFSPGTLEFFEEHKKIIIQDCFAGKIDDRVFPSKSSSDCILDLGCGPGFWTVELGLHGCDDLHASDLTQTALELTKKRCKLYEIDCTLSKGNAEILSFPNNFFSHVNCLGVIHHTPDTNSCISEIARVLKPNGTATISVYYKNILLRSWPVLRKPAKWLGLATGGLKGRGREEIFLEDDTNEIVRLFDGKDNPIGKAYSKQEFSKLLKPHFQILKLYFHFFPLRALPFSLPKILHKFLDRWMGFMIFANLRKF